jgi:hypothetical protein
MTMKCFSCGWLRLTWTEARKSYTRMTDADMTPDEAKRRSPCCYRCTTSMLRAITPVSVISEVSDPGPASTHARHHARAGGLRER